MSWKSGGGGQSARPEVNIWGAILVMTNTGGTRRVVAGVGEGVVGRSGDQDPRGRNVTWITYTSGLKPGHILE